MPNINFPPIIVAQMAGESGEIKFNMQNTIPIEHDDLQITVNKGLMFNAYLSITAAKQNNIIAYINSTGTTRTWTIPDSKHEGAYSSKHSISGKLIRETPPQSTV